LAKASVIGYPRIGRHRELKRATEGYWTGKVDRSELDAVAASIRKANWEIQRDTSIDLIPSNDFTLYDQMLDTIAMVGAVPDRYSHDEAGSNDGASVDLDTYFAMARGAQRRGLDVTALEMVKWFDTNYHYLVPELDPGQTFRLASTKPFDEYGEARRLGIATKPVLIGPVTFLLLSKSHVEGFDPLDLLDGLLPVYVEVVSRLAAQGAEWIQLDEPCFVQDRSELDRAALSHAYSALAGARGGANLLVQTYFGTTAESYTALASLPVQAIGLDFVRGGDQIDQIALNGFPEDKVLVAGVVDGRNVWVTDLDGVLDLFSLLTPLIPPDRLFVGSSCSLQHVPIDVRVETNLPPELSEWLAFAGQKLHELAILKRAVDTGPDSVNPELEANREVLKRRRHSGFVHLPEVKERAAAAGPQEASRGVPYEERQAAQHRSLGLPAFPTTTIGSFPQTPEVRRNRNRLRRGEMTWDDYDSYIAGEIRELVRYQEELGLDVLVHGEFERSDMVEYFGERLEGIATTEHAWVQSYGTRYVRPPIIFGDVHRPEPMTVRWSTYAQSLTDQPVKGMLTGPVTILNWSFVRDDQARSDTCKQIALAIRDEVRDLEAAGIRIIQVDEPALREGLPLRRAEWQRYLDWAVLCYRLATGVAGPGTQIHSHMCYSHFDDIIEAIDALDADVISMSNSRSDLDLLRTFRHFNYRKEIGPGVYDIHSPRVPSGEEMERNLRAAGEVLSLDQLWVNPDCGLKTRRWEEVKPALANMVHAARRLRESTVPV
jgi:5-methyltetrahydropteroyltriglutamate--homocysteine methyltransferase